MIAQRVYLVCGLLALCLLGCSRIPRHVRQSRPKVISQKQMDLTPYQQKPAFAFVGGVGDRLRFSLLESRPHQRVDLQIDPTGFISVPFVGRIKASGLTLESLHEEINKKLQRYFRDPHVSLHWKEVVSARVTVLGLVNRPGVVSLPAPEKLSTLLARVGGLRRGLNGITAGDILADLSKSFVVRPGVGIITPNFQALLRGQPQQDIWIQAGDTVFLPRKRRHRYMALGEFNKPGRLVQNREVKMLDLVALSGGLKPSASGDLLIIRGSLALPKVSRIPYADILTGASANITLRPGDIIYAPTSGLAKFDRIVRRILPLVSVLFDGVRTFTGTGVIVPSISTITQKP